MSRDTTTKAFDVLTDLTMTPRDAVLAAGHLLRRHDDINAAFVLGMGMRFREIKACKRFDEIAVDRWADDGGPA